MSACCSDSVCSSTSSAIPPRYRRVLWIALVANLAMFGVEIVAGWNANSVSLLADAVDFFGDAANYGLSLAVLRSEEHTSELQSLMRISYAVFCLKKQTNKQTCTVNTNIHTRTKSSLLVQHKTDNTYY